MSVRASLLLALAACHRGVPTPAPIGNSAKPTLELQFGTAEKIDVTHHALKLMLAHAVTPTHIPVFEVTDGRVVDAPIHLEAEDVGNTGEEKLYSVELPGSRSDESYDDVAIFGPVPAIAVVSLTPAEIQALREMHRAGVREVTDVRQHGLDLDGDGKADIAIVALCVRDPGGDSLPCDPATFAVQRTAAGWQLTEFCSRPEDYGGCKP